MKNTIGILIGIALNLWIALGSIDILTVLILPIHEHGIPFQLLVSSSVSFLSVLQCLEYSSSNSLITFFPGYFIHQFALVEVGFQSIPYLHLSYPCLCGPPIVRCAKAVQSTLSSPSEGITLYVGNSFSVSVGEGELRVFLCHHLGPEDHRLLVFNMFFFILLGTSFSIGV